MHWFWRAMIACVAGLLAAVGLGLVMFLSIKNRTVGTVTYLRSALSPMTLFNLPVFAVSIGVYAGLTRLFPACPAGDHETRCRKCGYVLRGISEPRCPECGERI